MFHLHEDKEKRHLWNIWMFIISFMLSNIISGVIYDAYINYLQEVARPIAISFWSYYGYATFISAIMVLFVTKAGYKWTLLFCPSTCFVALAAVLYIDIPVIYQITSILSLVGLQLHYAILAPYIAAHTNLENKTLWYSRTYWIGYAGWALMTYVGGFLTVSRFASRLGQSFHEARKLTKNIEIFTPEMKQIYIYANRDVLFITAIVAGLSLIPILLIKEKKEDYQNEVDKTKTGETFKVRAKAILKVLTNKYALSYVCYWALINFGMGLFSPYYTVFLNRNLGIDRMTASLLVSISYAALVLFMIFTPKVVKRFGQIITLAGVSLLSIPFMIMIANGDKFGVYTIPVVGLALFIRSGLMNLGYPVDSALPMEIVPKSLRPAMSSLINLVAGVVSIGAGWYTGNFLFLEQSGYRIGYYIAAICYVVGCLILLIVFTKKYNRLPEQ
ncbi:MFS transporter [Clostridiaceae bacterium 35-E11]